MPRAKAAEPGAATKCDLCKAIVTRQGRNAGIVHILKFTDSDELEKHLKAVFTTPYCVEFHLSFWFGVHQLYGHVAHDKYFPLWLVYLEAHKVKVNNRAEVIMRYRGRTPRQETIGMEGMDL